MNVNQSRESEYFFDDLGAPNDCSTKGEISAEIRGSEFAHRESFQILSTEVRAKSAKQKQYFFE